MSLVRHSSLFGMPLAAALLLLLGGGCSSMRGPAEHTVRPGWHRHTVPVRVQGRRRHYRVYVPAGHTPARAAPVVVVLHSAFSSGRELAAWSGLNAHADRDGVLVVYPEGFGIFGRLQHWNAGHCCGRAARRDIDDMGYLEHVVADVRTRFTTDGRNLYLVGYSNGGMMAHRFAATSSVPVAAIAVVAGPVGSSTSEDAPVVTLPAPARTVPALLVHGTADAHIPYAGGAGPRNPGRRYVPAIETARFWARANGLADTPARLTPAGRGIEGRAWGAGVPGREVVMLSLEGWDHAWPGGTFTARLDPEHPLHRFETGVVIWSFFRRHGLPRGQAGDED